MLSQLAAVAATKKNRYYFQEFTENKEMRWNKEERETT